ncbi:MAG TPA: hypothetical protein VNS46_21650 [Nocardioides sp.]|nr:hypothetical protein [Nocardioides sp.]
MSADSRWLPTHCPSWCDGDHAEVYADSEDWEAAQEHVAGGPGGCLDIMLNPIDKRIVREGGAGWELDIRQRAMEGGGLLDEATINLEIHASDYSRINLHLTTGEARVLARQLVAMADRVDL